MSCVRVTISYRKSEATISALKIKLFGPIQVLVDGQPLPVLRSRKALWLLALLSLRADRPVEREWIASTLWPDNERSQGFANLRTVLSELRKALGAQGWRLQTLDRHTVSLCLTEAEVDVRDFGSGISGGDRTSLERAVTLYNGEFLEGCREEWVFQERAARERDCVHALQKLGDIYLAMGDSKAAVAWFGRAASIDPWSDSARRGMMESLARTGDVNEALRVYRSFEDLLRADSNATPDERTTALYQRLRPRARHPAASPQEPTPVEGHLPHPLTELVGRDDERSDVAALLRRSRLVTLSGLGGIGKTRLAIAVAADLASEFPDGIWFVALDLIGDGKLVAPNVGAVLGIKEVHGKTWLQSIAANLRKKKLLLVLDNCEHLLESCNHVAAHLLQECAGVRILCTSRETLGIPGESAWAVPALAVPDPNHLPTGLSTMRRVVTGYEGVQLFLERAQSVARDFALTPANARTVAEICFRLEGVPLAIELAAARVKSMTVEELLTRLSDRLGLLAMSHRGPASRRHALGTTLDWSHQLLDDRERILFRRLSAFVGGWTLTAAEMVCTDSSEILPDQVLHLLNSLVEKSLVVFRETPRGGRYRFLEMVRQYTGMKLEEASETECIREKFIDWCAVAVEEAETWFNRPEQPKWLERIEEELPNSILALEWCEQDPARTERYLRITGALGLFWHRRGRHREGSTYLLNALAKDKARTPTAVRAKVLRSAVDLAGPSVDPEDIRAWAEECLSIYRHLGDSTGAVQATWAVAKAAYDRFDLSEAWNAFSQAHALSQEIGDAYRTAFALNCLAHVAHLQGETERAKELYGDGVARAREVGELNLLAWGLDGAGNFARELGEHDAAHRLLQEGLDASREVGCTPVTMSALNNLGNLASDRGDYDAARSLIAQSIRISEQVGDPRGMGIWLRSLGEIDMCEGDDKAARSNFEESLRLTREFGDRNSLAATLLSISKLALRTGDLPLARTRLDQSLEIYQTIKVPAGLLACREHRAALDSAEPTATLEQPAHPAPHL